MRWDESSSYRSNRLGLSHWDPYAMWRGSCLELYYCNMVEWFWCSVIFVLIYFLVLVLVLPTTKSCLTCWRRRVDDLPKYRPSLVTDSTLYGRSTRKRHNCMLALSLSDKFCRFAFSFSFSIVFYFFVLVSF